MFDIEKMLKQLQDKATQIAEEVDVDATVESAKDMAKKVQNKIETDENARNAAIGGGALLTVLMASKGGRKLVGNVAKTGAVAALGAIAWNAWSKRDGADATGEGTEYGFAGNDAEDPAFSIAVVESMAAAAHADGVLDEDEASAIKTALNEGGLNETVLDETVSREDILNRISSAAVTPNHAVQLYAAACAGACEVSAEEGSFLQDLAAKLELDANVAARVRAEMGI
ncbi:DUF533 domain-containing protein [Hirschia maritima]|uniref:DUF533 domain-containing protein n=1 Tax=Hirschia maritima TaxID=1121961 RepID=UPI000377FC28|nr:DUF533 domain-containing protein [Hirschia maritima]